MKYQMSEELKSKIVHTEFTVAGFFGDYRPFSNFHRCKFVFKGEEFTSSEQAFMWLKTDDPKWKEKILKAETPGEAKALGKKCPLIEGWDGKRINAMERILIEKFHQNKDLWDLLENTGEAALVELNDWCDNFWGYCVCDKCKNKQKYNHLGKTLIYVRRLLVYRRQEKLMSYCNSVSMF